MYFEDQRLGGYNFFDDELRMQRTGHIPLPRGPFAGITPMHIIHALATFFVGMSDYGAAMPSKFFLDRPIGLTWFKDGVIDFLLTTDAEMFHRHVRMMRHRPIPPDEQDFALTDYQVGNTRVHFNARIAGSLLQRLHNDSVHVTGSCELIFMPGPRAPREANIAGLRILKKIDTDALLLYNLNLTENRLVLAHGIARRERVRSRTPRTPRLR